MTLPSSTFHGLHHEPTQKRVRGLRNGHVVIDSTRVELVWEHRYFPQWYVPRIDVHASFVPSSTTPDRPPRANEVLGDPSYLDLVLADGDRVDAAAWTFDAVDALADRVRFAWDAMDQWLEEDEPVLGTHPRDPYTRVECLSSSQPVRIEIDGTVVAESARPTILFETGLRRRWYLPPTDVRLDLLEPSATKTLCPYKGEASYHSVRIGGTVHEDLVWCYPSPSRESAPIAGLLCFYDERVDLFVGGERQS